MRIALEEVFFLVFYVMHRQQTVSILKQLESNVRQPARCGALQLNLTRCRLDRFLSRLNQRYHVSPHVF